MEKNRYIIVKFLRGSKGSQLYKLELDRPRRKLAQRCPEFLLKHLWCNIMQVPLHVFLVGNPEATLPMTTQTQVRVNWLIITLAYVTRCFESTSGSRELDLVVNKRHFIQPVFLYSRNLLLELLTALCILLKEFLFQC